MECVDLKDSDDVVLDEVLCVEEFEVDVFFARLLVPCRVAMLLPAVESVWMRRFSLLQMLVSSRTFLRCSPSLTPVQMA